MTQQPITHFAVLHHIHDPAGWAEALNGEHCWPDTFDLRSFVEADDHHLAICVWTAPNHGELQQSLDTVFGHAAVNELCPVQIHQMQQTEPTN